jgi:hypothetical protein
LCKAAAVFSNHHAASPWQYTAHSHIFHRWLRGASDVFCGGMLDALQQQCPIKVKLFYTRSLDATGVTTAKGDNSQASDVASTAGVQLNVMMPHCKIVTIHLNRDWKDQPRLYFGRCRAAFGNQINACSLLGERATR